MDDRNFVGHFHERLVQAKTDFDADHHQVHGIRKTQSQALLAGLGSGDEPQFRNHPAQEQCHQNESDRINASRGLSR